MGQELAEKQIKSLSNSPEEKWAPSLGSSINLGIGLLGERAPSSRWWKNAACAAARGEDAGEADELEIPDDGDETSRSLLLPPPDLLSPSFFLLALPPSFSRYGLQ
jgi:hypothetical protein